MTTLATAVMLVLAARGLWVFLTEFWPRREPLNILSWMPPVPLPVRTCRRWRPRRPAGPRLCQIPWLSNGHDWYAIMLAAAVPEEPWIALLVPPELGGRVYAPALETA
jgi:hypothetical protein